MAGETDNRVVVNIRCSTRFDEDNCNFVAHFTDLGLVARGHTEEEAITNCKQLFNKLVNSYRQYGGLEGRLNRSGADWWWEDDYPKTEPPPENTDVLMVGEPVDPNPGSTSGEISDSVPREFAMAA